jgi:integrase
VKGLPIVAEKQTVAQYLENWLDGMKMEVEPSTWWRYQNEVEKHILPVIGKVALSHLTAQQVTGLYSQLLEKNGLAASTVHLTHLVLSHALADAVKMALVQRNEAKLAKSPRAKAKEMQPLTEDQANHFLDFVAGHRFEALYVLALTTGMREGELLALHWREVHLEQRLLRVVWNVKEKQGRDGHKIYYLGDTKTDAGTRTIQFGDLALEALKAHQAKQNVEKLGVGLDLWQEQDLVFSGHLGGLYKPTALYSQFIRLLKSAGLPKVRFHDLRHTCATILLAHGIPVKQVSEMLGHADIAITLRVYGHVLPTLHQAAADLMDLVFRKQA